MHLLPSSAAARERAPGRGSPRLTRNVVPGVHRLEHAHVNCYLLDDAQGITIVDAALPATWRHVPAALDAIGRIPSDVRAVVLTHAHFDHLGFARRIRTAWGVPILGHALEQPIASHPYRYAHESPRFGSALRHVSGAAIIARMAAAGALMVPGVDDLEPIAPGTELDLPGRPRVVFTPGHTFGHCALHLPAADAVLTGDALVTLDPYTGARGPRLVSRDATADSAAALDALDALDELDASVLLPGHGEPWRDGVRAATAAARRAGVH
ncbi:MBL fold metallo-hydrolase [Pseudoclavibacter endophyticus]|uniref:MBL fold metallo-hydrolase n=1 Tax=Pseudoclavibacter endophyticus TaxID=1778590 RepID=A0A6H9WKP8_9MICO|nr:MBL fold metallo-hydrolase [Pseudoclavibacter endophyticus]KAB1649386.1 MBL fold metallo-hydrolase [Pseudoclavibacter endophyticus]GGA63036.1 MBL fold metallo-hydrolase [Pseudoclavibacter endophyticus]